MHVQTLLRTKGEGQIRHSLTETDTADAGEGRLALLDAGHRQIPVWWLTGSSRNDAPKPSDG